MSLRVKPTGFTGSWFAVTSDEKFWVGSSGFSEFTGKLFPVAPSGSPRYIICTSRSVMFTRHSRRISTLVIPMISTVTFRIFAHITHIRPRIHALPIVTKIVASTAFASMGRPLFAELHRRGVTAPSAPLQDVLSPMLRLAIHTAGHPIAICHHGLPLLLLLLPFPRHEFPSSSFLA